MSKNLSKTVIILLAVTFVTLQSCEKKSFVGKGEIEILPKISYDKTNDMLVFATKEDMTEYINSVNIGEPVLQIDKEFVSLSTILHNVVNSEMALENKYEELYKDKDLSDEELKLIIDELDSKPLENITKEFIAKGIIKIVKEKESSHFDLTTCAPYYATVLNSNNMVKAGDTIYEYSADKIKLITDGDFSKIPLLKSSSETNINNKIEIINVSSEDKSQHMFYYKYQIEEYDKKLIVTAFLNTYYWYGEKAYVYCEKFYCEKRNFWGNWVDDTNAEVIIKDFLIVETSDGMRRKRVLDHSSGYVVFHNTSCYSGSVFVYNDTNNYSNLNRHFSQNNILWTRSGGPSGFSKVVQASSYNW